MSRPKNRFLLIPFFRQPAGGVSLLREDPVLSQALVGGATAGAGVRCGHMRDGQRSSVRPPRDSGDGPQGGKLLTSRMHRENVSPV